MFGFSGGKAKLTKNGVEVNREKVRIELSREKNNNPVKTGHVFLDNVINGLSEYSPFSLTFENNGSKDGILEKSGFAIGMGLRKLLDNEGKKYASFIHSDGKAMCMFSIDLSRDMRGSTIQLIGKPREFEPNDLFMFFDSISQGMDSEISGVVNIVKRKNKETDFVSEALGLSLKEMFK